MEQIHLVPGAASQQYWLVQRSAMKCIVLPCTLNNLALTPSAIEKKLCPPWRRRVGQSKQSSCWLWGEWLLSRLSMQHFRPLGRWPPWCTIHDTLSEGSLPWRGLKLPSTSPCSERVSFVFLLMASSPPSSGNTLGCTLCKNLQRKELNKHRGFLTFQTWVWNTWHSAIKGTLERVQKCFQTVDFPPHLWNYCFQRLTLQRMLATTGVSGQW